MSFNFFHGSEDNFYAGSNNDYNIALGSFTRWGSPNPETVLKALQDNYNAKYTAAVSTNRTKSAPSERRAARKTLTDAVLAYGEEFLFHNSKLTIADKFLLDIHIDKEPEQVPKPTTIPIIVVILSVIRKLTFKCYTKPGDKRTGKPPRTPTFVLYWAILDHEPTDISELINRTATSGYSIDLLFKEADRGKKLYYAGCWQIARDNLEGPLSQIEYVSIP
jgi:hypothetical protein